MTNDNDILPHHLTFDVEEYFQVEAARRCVDRRDWDTLASRLDEPVRLILDLLARHAAHATFFVLGQAARRCGQLVAQIASAGHEIASHGMSHHMLGRLTPRSFAAELGDSRHILEDLAGQRIIGFRAPTFSITHATAWALEVLAQEGWQYDSSIFPIRHDRYGVPDAPRDPHWATTLTPGPARGEAMIRRPGSHTDDAGMPHDENGASGTVCEEASRAASRRPAPDGWRGNPEPGSATTPLPLTPAPAPGEAMIRRPGPGDQVKILELPPLTSRTLGVNWPVGGGGYLRLLPAWMIARFLAAAQRRRQPAMIYLHPWELDPGQPVLAMGRLGTWRHRVNLHRTADKLQHLLARFRFSAVRDNLPALQARTTLSHHYGPKPIDH